MKKEPDKTAAAEEETKITVSKAVFETPHIRKPPPAPTKADVHFHPTNYAQQGSSPGLLLDAMDEMGLKYTVLSPIPTNLLVQCGRCEAADHHPRALTEEQYLTLSKLWNQGVWSKALWQQYSPALGSNSFDINSVPNYYISDMLIRQSPDELNKQLYEQLIQKDGPLYYNTEVDDETAARYLALTKEQQLRFDPMVTGLVLGDMRCSESLIGKLNRNPGVFTGVGEITVYKEWVQEKVGLSLQADMTSRACALIKLMNTCGVIGMPVVLHCDVDVMPWDMKLAAPLHFDNICNFLGNKNCKDTTIIWAHAGGIGKYSRIGLGHLERLRSVLKNPNLSHVSFDLSWDTVAKQLTMDTKETAPDPKKIEELIALLDDYPSRFLFGSDSLSPNDMSAWQSTEIIYKAVFDNVKPETAHAVKLGNYERMIVGARHTVRLYEKYCVEYAALASSIRQDNGRPAEVNMAMRAAITDAVQWGLAMRDHELDPKKPAPPKEIQARLVSVKDLKNIATKVLVGKEMPWHDVPSFQKYLNQTSKL